jgi:hypothetical protein
LGAGLSGATAMTKYWCVNFDSEASLQHGIKQNLWMMQSQYADDHGNEHQGYKKGAISRNWNQVGKIKHGHRFVGYQPGNRRSRETRSTQSEGDLAAILAAGRHVPVGDCG